MARTLARSNMVAERNRTKSTAPSATAVTTYQKRERSILIPFPGVELGCRTLGNGERHIDDCPPEHEGAWRADRRSREENLEGVFPRGELRDQEHALRARVRDGGDVRLDDDPASHAGSKLVAELVPTRPGRRPVARRERSHLARRERGLPDPVQLVSKRIAILEVKPGARRHD